MTDKKFFREQNIWRLIGLALALIGIGLIISPFDAIVYKSDGWRISVGMVVLLFGFVGVYPTLREAIAKRAQK